MAETIDDRTLAKGYAKLIGDAVRKHPILLSRAGNSAVNEDVYGVLKAIDADLAT